MEFEECPSPELPCNEKNDVEATGNVKFHPRAGKKKMYLLFQEKSLLEIWKLCGRLNIGSYGDGTRESHNALCHVYPGNLPQDT